MRGRSPTIESSPVPQWVRPLDQSTTPAAEWHVPRTRSFTTTTYCGKNLAGPIEVASDDKAERAGRCRQCVTSLGPTREGIVPQRPARPLPQKQTSPVKKTAAKRIAAKPTVRKPAPNGRSAKAPVAKRAVRPLRRPKA